MFGNENGTPREQVGVPWVFVFSHEKKWMLLRSLSFAHEGERENFGA